MSEASIGGSPYKVPAVRRSVPSFNRDRIVIGGSGPAPVKRVWKDTLVTKVDVGDTVAEFGIVAEIAEMLHIPDGFKIEHVEDRELVCWRVRLYNVVGDVKDYPGHTRVMAFTGSA